MEGALLLLLFVACTFVAVVIQTLMLAFAVPHLRRNPEERTGRNVLSVVFAAAFVLASAVMVAFALTAAGNG